MLLVLLLLVVVVVVLLLVLWVNAEYMHAGRDRANGRAMAVHVVTSNFLRLKP